MLDVVRKLSRLPAIILIGTILSANVAWASKPLDAASAKLKIQKLGLDHYVRIYEGNGIQLHGRILAVNDQSFQVQLWNQPQPVDIRYDQVTQLDNLGWSKGKVAFLVVGIAAVAGFATYGFVHVHDLANKPLPTPTVP